MTFTEFKNSLGASSEAQRLLIKCPCHNDNKASLSVGEGRNGQLIVHCFAGCDPVKILRELTRGYNPHKVIEQKERRELRLFSAIQGFTATDCANLVPDNPPQILRRPLVSKAIGSTYVYGLRCLAVGISDRRILRPYSGVFTNGASKLNFGIDVNSDKFFHVHGNAFEDVYIVEGASDFTCLTVLLSQYRQQTNWAAIGIPSATSKCVWTEKWRPCKRVWLFPDQDKPGRILMSRLEEQLHRSGVQMVTWCDDRYETKDIRQHIIENGWEKSQSLIP